VFLLEIVNGWFSVSWIHEDGRLAVPNAPDVIISKGRNGPNE